MTLRRDPQFPRYIKDEKDRNVFFIEKEMDEGDKAFLQDLREVFAKHKKILIVGGANCEIWDEGTIVIEDLMTATHRLQADKLSVSRIGELLRLLDERKG